MSFNTGTHSSNGLLEEIQELIKDEGLTVTKLAVEMGYSRKALSRFLNGHNTYTDFHGLFYKRKWPLVSF